MGWNDITVTEIYAVHDIRPFLEEELLRAWKKAERTGSRSTTRGRSLRASNTELDLRGCVTEFVI